VRGRIYLRCVASASPIRTHDSRCPGSIGIALGTRRFAALVGQGAAYELLAAGARYEASRALEIGLASLIESEAQ
jgi:hypothetical protein